MPLSPLKSLLTGLRTFVTLITAALLLASGVALAAPRALSSAPALSALPPMPAEYVPGLTLHGGSSALGEAAADTFYLYGGPSNPTAYGDPAARDGKFETADDLPSMDGWVGVDLTEGPVFWQRSTFSSPTATQALWAGRTAAQEPGWAAAPGYGNNWNTWIDYRATVNDNTASTTVTWDFVYNYDTEPAYDYFRAQYDSAGTMRDLVSVSGSNKDGGGVFQPVTANVNVMLQPGDYVGLGADEVHLRFRVDSDGGFSDQDGLWPTDGAASVDDVTVDVGANGGFTTDDFEAGLGNWVLAPRFFAGDFAKVFPEFSDIDPCRSNSTPQIGFLDDGTPPSNAQGQSTGGSTSANWSYGIPGGYVTNNTGGVSQGFVGILNEVWSPEIDFDLPGTADDDAVGVLLLGFDVWAHLPINTCLVYNWRVRSFDGVDWTAWDGFENFGFTATTPAYRRVEANIARLIPDFSTLQKVQIALRVRDWSATCDIFPRDATPSPLYDNVSLRKVAAPGPQFLTRALDLLQDSFPQSGARPADYDGPGGPNDEAAFAVRLDRASSINWSNASLLAGDSLTADIVPTVPGTDIAGPPVLKYRLFANPAFDHVRNVAVHASSPGTIVGPGGEGAWTVWDGTAAGSEAMTPLGGVIEDRYAFDPPFDGPARNPGALPEPAEPSGFFPGDWFFYYLEATDTAGNVVTIPSGPGGGAPPVGWPQLLGEGGPVDGTAGLARVAFNRNFRIRALPSMNGNGTTPPILLVNDAFGQGNHAAWRLAFLQIGLFEGEGYDDFTVMSPTSGIDHGIGSAGLHGATAGQLAGYDCLLYDSGNLSRILLSDGTDQIGGTRTSDQAVLTAWRAQDADRYAAYFGDNLASYLADRGPAYLSEVLGGQLGAGGAEVRGAIDDQAAPQFAPTPAVSGLFASSMVAFGGCLNNNRFDHLGPLTGSGAVQSHEFLTSAGGTGAFDAAAGVWFDTTESGARKVALTFPFGFQSVRGPAMGVGLPDGRSARAVLLTEVLGAFGHSGQLHGVAADARGREAALHGNTPNPFNPSTEIAFFVPFRERVRLQVYDLRGRLVRHLANQVMESGERTVRFDGRDDAGSILASGVYFYELIVGSSRFVHKMGLVK